MRVNVCGLYMYLNMWGAYDTFLPALWLALWKLELGSVTWCLGAWLTCLDFGFVLAMWAIYRSSRMREAAALYSFLRYMAIQWIVSCTFLLLVTTCILKYLCYLLLAVFRAWQGGWCASQCCVWEKGRLFFYRAVKLSEFVRCFRLLLLSILQFFFPSFVDFIETWEIKGRQGGRK